MSIRPHRALPSGTSIAQIRLRVQSLRRSGGFYREILGFREIEGNRELLSLSANGKPPAQIILEEQPGVPPRNISSPGLFHVAFLLPNRRELARILKHVGSVGWKFQGFADHGVSEALYLADAEGNGVELYRDRKRNQWTLLSGGLVEMVTAPLDVQHLLLELEGDSEEYEGIHPDATIGHIHLQVSDLQRAGRFYHEVLGFDVTQRSYPGALFLSAGGYHHHIGLNIWNSRGSEPLHEKTAGLAAFTISIPERQVLSEVLSQTESSGNKISRNASVSTVEDPDGLHVMLVEHPI